MVYILFDYPVLGAMIHFTVGDTEVDQTAPEVRVSCAILAAVIESGHHHHAQYVTI